MNTTTLAAVIGTHIATDISLASMQFWGAVNWPLGVIVGAALR